MTAQQSPVAVFVVHLVDERTGLAVCDDLVPARFPVNDTTTPRQLCRGCHMIALGWRQS